MNDQQNIKLTVFSLTHMWVSESGINHLVKFSSNASLVKKKDIKKNVAMKMDENGHQY